MDFEAARELSPSTEKAAGSHSPAAGVDYIPDPRNEPAYWTARKLLDERRPREREDGSGGMRRLWVACQACKVERVVDPNVFVGAGQGDKPLGEIRLRCKCGGNGLARLTWANPPRPQSDAERASGKWRIHKPRTGWFDFATGQKHGGWD